jgi:hypothetical protein
MNDPKKITRRGPKVKTPRNSPPVIPIDCAGLQPTVSLCPVGRAEFARLVSALRAKGLLEKADLGCISQAARLKARLDKAHDADDLKAIGILSSQLRGTMREIALTLQPSKNSAKPAAAGGFSQWSQYLNRKGE